MAQMVVRNLDNDVKLRLKKRALRHGWSMEEEVRRILQSVISDDRHPAPKLGTKIARRFAGKGLSGDLPEFHGQTIHPMDLDK